MKPQNVLSLPVGQKKFIQEHWPLPDVSSWRLKSVFSDTIPFVKEEKNKFPYGISKEVFQTKVLVLGTNFLLSALAALQLSRQMVPFLLCPFVFSQEDWWSYDFLKNASFRRFVEETTKFSGKVSAVHGLQQEQEEAFLSEWIDSFFAYLASEIVRTDFHDGFKMDVGYTYEAYAKPFQLSKDTTLAGLYAFPYIPPERNIPQVQNACEQAFISHVLKVLPRVDFTPNLKGAHHLFGEAVLLTSFLPALCPVQENNGGEGRFFFYPLSEIYPFGSARQTPFQAQQAIRETPEDILRLTRFDASFLKK